MTLRVRIVSVVAAVVLATGAIAARAQVSLENRLKAAIVSKFPQFVDWPASALAGRSTVDICVAPENPFGGDLQDLVAGQTVSGHPLAVRTIDRDQDVDGCQVLFVPAASLPARRALLQRAAPRPVLTISDDPATLDEGGIVRLRVVDGRVRFDIDADAARRAGLRISSQLLRLAANVRGAQS